MKNHIKFNPCVCKRHEDEPVVQNNLAVTPSQMDELRRQGFSISAQNIRMLDMTDGTDKDFYVPIQYRRGVDIADVWNYSQDVRQKLKDAVGKVDSGEIQDLSRKE